MKFLALSVVSIGLLLGPVLGEFRDILEITNETPYTGAFRRYLLKNPDILALYQGQRNSTIYVPSDKAMRKCFPKNNAISRRGTASNTVQALYMIEQQANAIRAAQSQSRSVRKTADTQTSPNGGSSVVVTVNDGSPPIKRHYRVAQKFTGIKIQSGAGSTVNIMFGDIQCLQGLIHVIDGCFNVPEPVTSTLQSIGAIKFLDALNTAKLGASSDASGQITIFAPNDAAFVNQPPLDASGINHHTVVDVALYSTLLLDNTKFKTLAGDYLYVNIVGGQVFINCVPILASDLLASGGTVHTMGKIIPSLSAPPVTC